MATFLYRLGAFGARRWRTTLIGWLVALAAVVGLGLLFPGSFQNTDSIPGSPAQTALTRVDRHWPDPNGIGDPDARRSGGSRARFA
ncbi:hypothetical protein AB0958_11200 [Streptomyces sp. NPDC006655]|uniref:hypothetical protein n=1 Tax=Streptomyces sp. NPDC006655 TaxID=3156898 RepID=UPI003453B901